MDAASYTFTNAVEQLKIVNPRVTLITEGTEMLYQVKEGQIVAPEGYMWMADEEVDNEEDDHQEMQDESNHEEDGEEGV
jgi:hypothetical protein